VAKKLQEINAKIRYHQEAIERIGEADSAEKAAFI
jgi:hypothetical protein